MVDSQRNQAYLTELLDWARKTKQFGWDKGAQLKEGEIRALNTWQEEMNELIQDIHRYLHRPFSPTLYAPDKRANKPLYTPSGSPSEDAEQILEFEQRASQLYYKLMDLLAKKSSQPFSQAFKKEQVGNQAAQGQEEIESSSSAGMNHEEMHEVPHRTVPIGEHKLPPLPYSYDALEPYISEEIMRLHHDKHHQSYVDGLNKAERKMAEARRSGDFELIKHWEREAAFHGSGHYLHTIFWNVMKPRGGGAPTGELARRIQHDFGSFEHFKRHFTQAANEVEGVGWAILVWSPRAQRLEILQADKHQHFAQWDVIPLLVLDVWEHAYYLQYHTDKKKYIENWWNLVNWNHVQHRFNEAVKVRWYPY